MYMIPGCGPKTISFGNHCSGVIAVQLQGRSVTGVPRGTPVTTCSDGAGLSWSRLLAILTCRLLQLGLGS